MDKYIVLNDKPYRSENKDSVFIARQDTDGRYQKIAMVFSIEDADELVNCANFFAE